MRHAICETGHLLKFNVPLTQSNLFLFEKDELPLLLPKIPDSLGGIPKDHAYKKKRLLRSHARTGSG